MSRMGRRFITVTFDEREYQQLVAYVDHRNREHPSRTPLRIEAVIESATIERLEWWGRYRQQEAAAQSRSSEQTNKKGDT